MVFQELSRRKVVVLTAAVILFSFTLLLCWYLEGHNLSVLIPVLGIGLGFGTSVLFAMEPEVARMFPPKLWEILPGFKGVTDRLQEVEDSGRLVREMEASLAFYNIACVPLGQRLRDEVTQELQDAWLKDDRGRLQQCGRLFSPIVGILPEVLSLLYRERQELEPQTLWSGAAERDARLADLAKVLAESRIVDRYDGEELHLHPDEIQVLLEPLSTFLLEEFLIELRVVRDVHRVGEKYWKFFTSNFQAVDETLEARDLLSGVVWSGGLLQCKTACADIERSLVPTLLHRGEEALRKEPRLESAAEREAMAALALLLFSARSDIALEKSQYARLCNHLARTPEGAAPPESGEGVRLAWLYLVAKQEFRSGLWGETARYLSLDLFLERRDDIRNRREEEHDELESLYYELCAGRWVMHRDELIDRAFSPHPQPTPPGNGSTQAEEVEVDEKRLADAIRRIPHSEVPLKNLFRRLRLTTLEHFAETKRLRPYLITLGRSTGPIPALLDCLASERKTEALAKADIDVWTSDGTRKYNFEHYTPFARIGVVPRGVAFIDFCQELKEDLRRALRKQDLLLPPGERMLNSKDWSYEVLVHTFRPAIGNPYEFGQPVGKGPAMQRVKQILAAHVEEEDLAQLGRHLHDFQTGTRTSLVAALMTEPISKLSGLTKQLTPQARELLDHADARIKHELLSALNIGPYDDHALNRALQQTGRREQARKILEQAIQGQLPEPEEHLAPEVASEYLNELTATSNALQSLGAMLGRGHLVSSDGP